MDYTLFFIVIIITGISLIFIYIFSNKKVNTSFKSIFILIITLILVFATLLSLNHPYLLDSFSDLSLTKHFLGQEFHFKYSKSNVFTSLFGNKLGNTHVHPMWNSQSLTCSKSIFEYLPKNCDFSQSISPLHRSSILDYYSLCRLYISPSFGQIVQGMGWIDNPYSSSMSLVGVGTPIMIEELSKCEP